MTDTLLIRAPEDDAHVEASLHRMIQHIEQRAAAVRHPEVRGIEGDGEPDAVPCGANGFGDAADIGARRWIVNCCSHHKKRRAERPFLRIGRLRERLLLAASNAQREIL